MNLMTRAAILTAIVLLAASIFGVLGAVVASANPNETELERICINRFSNRGTNTRAYITTENGDIVPILPDVDSARLRCDETAENNDCLAGFLRPLQHEHEEPGFHNPCLFITGITEIDMFMHPWVCYGVDCLESP